MAPNLVIASLAFIVLASCSSPKLTESAVSAMTKDVEAAVSRRDADTVAAYFAPDASISMTFPDGNSQQLSPSEYKAALVQGWKDSPNSSYVVSDVLIVLSSDGSKARVSSTVTETAVVMGTRVSMVSQEKADVIAVDGKPRILRVTATMTMN